MLMNESGIRAFPCTAALGQGLRVKYDATYGLAVAGATDQDLGVLAQRHIVSGLGAAECAAVVLRNSRGTVQMVAAGAFDAYATVYGAANGKIDDTSNAEPIGTALEAATADGDLVEVLRFIGAYSHTHS